MFRHPFLLIPSLIAAPAPGIEQVSGEDSPEYVKSTLPVHTLLLPLTFASGPDMVLLLTPFLSTRGRVWSDARTSTLVIQDDRESLDRIRDIVRTFDVPAPVRGPVVIVRKVEILGSDALMEFEQRLEFERTREFERKLTASVTATLLPLRACFAKALARRPELGGPFWVALSIDKDGKVKTVDVEDSQTPLPESASECLRELFRGLRLSVDSSGELRARIELVYGIGAQHQ